jgi:hypothetical protein
MQGPKIDDQQRRTAQQLALRELLAGYALSERESEELVAAIIRICNSTKIHRSEHDRIVDQWLQRGEQRWLEVAATHITSTWMQSQIIESKRTYGAEPGWRWMLPLEIDRYSLWVPYGIGHHDRLHGPSSSGDRRYHCLLCYASAKRHRPCGCRYCGSSSYRTRRNYDAHEREHLDTVLARWKAFIPNRDKDTALVLGDALSQAFSTLARV